MATGFANVCLKFFFTDQCAAISANRYPGWLKITRTHGG